MGPKASRAPEPEEQPRPKSHDSSCAGPTIVALPMQDHSDRLPPAGRPAKLRRVRAAIGHDLGVDLGTANTLIHLRGRGVVLAQPSDVAIDLREGTLIGAGEEAREMLGRTPQ